MLTGSQILRTLFGAALIAGIVPCITSAAPIVGVPDSNANGKVDLADLIASGPAGFIIGDKHFNNFSYTPSGGANTPTAADISVDNFSTGTDEAIRFGFGWFTINGISMDSRIDYQVTVTDPNPATMIDGVDLLFNGIAVGSAVGDVAETVSDTQNNLLAQLFVFTDPDGSGPAHGVPSTSAPILPNQRVILVDKDIQLFSAPATGANNFASVSFVDNSYHQTPEPLAMTLLGLGGGLSMLRRRRTA